MLVRGAEPMEKAPAARPFPGFRFLFTCSFLLYPLILWITVFPSLSELTPLAAAPATERSERVGEEAEESLNWYVLRTHLCGISHRTWRTFHTIRINAT